MTVLERYKTRGGKYSIDIYCHIVGGVEYYGYGTFKNDIQDGGGIGYDTLESVKASVDRIIHFAKTIDNINYKKV